MEKPQFLIFQNKSISDFLSRWNIIITGQERKLPTRLSHLWLYLWCESRQDNPQRKERRWLLLQWGLEQSQTKFSLIQHLPLHSKQRERERKRLMLMTDKGGWREREREALLMDWRGLKGALFVCCQWSFSRGVLQVDWQVKPSMNTSGLHWDRLKSYLSLCIWCHLICVREWNPATSVVNVCPAVLVYF